MRKFGGKTWGLAIFAMLLSVQGCGELSQAEEGESFVGFDGDGGVGCEKSSNGSCVVDPVDDCVKSSDGSCIPIDVCMKNGTCTPTCLKQGTCAPQPDPCLKHGEPCKPDDRDDKDDADDRDDKDDADDRDDKDDADDRDDKDDADDQDDMDDADDRDDVDDGDDDDGCTLTQGYWKNHPESWPDGYDPEELLPILEAPPAGGNATLILAHQYIAALLNVAAGADDSAIADTLALAEAWFAAYSPDFTTAVHASTPEGQEAIALAEILASYNEGHIGPGHCDD
jgi:hypothetical protein